MALTHMVEHDSPAVEQVSDDALADFLTPGLGFPSPQLVVAAAAAHSRNADQTPSAMLHTETPLAEGRHFTLGVAAGVVAVRTLDHQRRARTEAQQPAAMAFAWHPPMVLREALPDPTPIRVITAWSRKSRALMTRRLSELDYAPLFQGGGTPGMVTLTYPGRWLEVAPAGEVVKKHLRTLMKRWARRWGVRPAYLWKMEFQRRGAPHFHLFIAVPGEPAEFRQWLSATWAAVVDADDARVDEHGNTERRRHLLAGTGVDFREGVKASDPKRLAVYFKKHGGAAGGKEYQHQVPEAWQTPETGPGRFWGYVGVDRVAREVYVTQDTYVKYRRALRRLADAQQLRRDAHPPRGCSVDRSTGEVRTLRRKVSRPVRRMAAGGLNGGFLLVNDGPSLVLALSRWDTPSQARWLP